MNVYTLTEKFEKSKLYMIIILRFETIEQSVYDTSTPLPLILEGIRGFLLVIFHS